MQTSGTAPRVARTKLAVSAGVVAVAVVGLIVWAMARPGSTAFYMTPTEVAALGAEAGATYRVNGKVVDGTVERDGLTTAFVITDGSTRLPVTTDAPLPDAFYGTDGVEVVALGSYDGTKFAATEVLAKCPSKFKAKSRAEVRL